MSRQQMVQLSRIPGGNLKENFEWAPDEYIRFLAQTEAGSIYRVRAIHVTDMNAPESTLTRNGIEFTEDELRAAARSLGYRPLNLNHEPPYLEFPQNRVIDAEFEDSLVEAIIAIREPSVMLLIEEKKIVVVSVEAQFRWADVVCNDQACWLRPVGIVFVGLGLLTPGVLPGDPLASIVLKKSSPASPVLTGMPSREGDTNPIAGGVLMENKEATPPPEPKPQTEPASQPKQAEPGPEPQKNTAEVKIEVDATKALDQIHCAQIILSEVQKIGAKVDSLESQVKLLQKQRQERNSENPNRQPRNL